jgi:GAF domain-containing protein/anti-sigma regulatory factor (Ser/Thr protein kinase)
VSDRAVIDRETVHVHDLTAAETEFPDARAGGLKWGVRTALATPLMREGVAIGAIHCRRMEVRPFTDKQIDLLKAFADQAVIAIENVRLFNETREALERQTATSDVLKAISRTTFDLDAVLRVLIESATRLAGASRGFIFRFDGEVARMVVSHNAPPDYVALIEANPISPGRSTLVGRALVECRPTHIPDVLADPEFQWNEAQRLGGFRSMLGVPMMRDGRPIGVIAMWSDEVKPFTEKQIELVTTFADQAVIAIENVRLFNETKESLERQTATAEILKVISRSPTDVQPVLDAIVQSAARLFVPWNAAIVMREGNFLHLRTSAGPRVLSREDKEAAQNRWPLPFDPEKSVTARVIADLQTRQILDTEAPDVTPGVKATGRAGKYRSIAWVPLVRDREGIGSIVLTHAQPGYVISEKQFALVRTFADQAVIAIENVRLFNETKEALERQTATAEILKVISQSTTDVQPVLEAIVGSAAKLFPQCNATVFMRDGGLLQLRAMDGATVNDRLREDLGRIYPVPFDPELSSSARAMVERRPNVCPDTEAPDVPEHIRRAGRAARFRSNTVVPLVRDDEGIGSIVLTNSKPGYALDKKQISLLQTFADQAVIAIENVRLFNETKEALERQTATAEILKVIADSPSDVQPVLEAVASSAGRLCEAKDVIVMLREGDHLRYRVHRGGISPAVPVGDTKRISRDWSAGRCAAEARQLHIHDILAAPDEFPDGSRMGKDAGYRTVLMTPLLREGVVLGVIGMRRAEVRPFEPRQIELINTFADQAVMAIENVRLFKELQSRTEALTKSVGQLTALGEVGQAISSTLDLDTVLQTIVSRAVQLTGLNGGTIYEFDERAGEFLLRAHENMPAELVEVYRSKPIRLGEGVVGSAAQKREALQVPDIQDPGYQTRYRDLLIRQGYRAILAVPLLREEQIIGALTVSRGEPGEFAPEVVELLKTFATQSAMAIQNARLFREIAEKSKQLEQASQHKSNFLASMSHELRTPLNAILGFNEMILGQVYGEVPADMQEPLADIQTSGKHLLRLINNVLDLAKIEAGRMELSLQDYSVHDTVESVRATLRPLAAEKGLEFLVAVPPELPLAYGDSGRITQCLMNLAGNSLKFTKAGKVEISVTEKDGLLTYRVTDTGVGIPPDKIGSLFTEFKQTDATIASEYGGTGLGLSISKKFVEMHGGRIWIESELGKGSTFIFEIPLRVNVT